MDINEKLRRMREIQERATNPAPVLNKIASDMLKEEQKNFKKKSSPDDVPWKKLSTETQKAKIKRGRNPNNILRYKSMLFGSLHAKIDEKSAITSTGPEIEYAKIHNYGGVIKKRERAGKMYFSDDGKLTKKGKASHYKDVNIREHEVEMPRRQFAGMSEKDLEKYAKWFTKYLTEGVL